MKSTKIKFILSISTLILCCIFMTVEVFAWFFLNSKDTLNDLNMDVVDIEGESDELIVSIEGITGDKAANLAPGEYLRAKLTIKNSSDSDKIYALKISDISISMPLATQGFAYDDKYIDVYSYYKDNTLYNYSSDSLYLTNKQEFFKQFIAPVSNSILFGASVIRQDVFSDQFASSGYITSESVVTDFSKPILEYSLNLSMPVSDIGLTNGTGIDSEGNNVVIKDGQITVAAKKEAVIFILIFFDPTKYVVSKSGIELRNSNPYLGQKLYIMVSN